MDESMSAKDLPRELQDCIYVLQNARMQIAVAQRSAAFWTEVLLSRGLISSEQHKVATSLIETGNLPEPPPPPPTEKI